MNLLVPVQGLKDALAAGHGPKQDVGLFAQSNDGVKQHVDETGKQYHAAQGHLVLDDGATPVPDDHAQGDLRHAVGEGPVEGFQAGTLELVVPVLFVDPGIALQILLLAI